MVWLTDVISAVEDISSSVLGQPFGELGYWVVLSCGLGLVLVTGKAVHSALQQGVRGWLPIFLAHVLMLGSALATAGALAVSWKEATDTPLGLAALIGAAVVVAVVIFLIVRKFLVGGTAGMGLVGVLFVLGIGTAGVFVGNFVMGFVDKTSEREAPGAEQLEQLIE